VDRRSGGADAVALLCHALRSEDYDVRAVAAASLGHVRPLAAVKARLIATLDDREPAVQRAAAEALLRRRADCARELGSRFRDLLCAYREFARQDWAAVARLGPPALPALFAAVEGANDVIRREARWVLAGLLPSYVPGLARSRGER
jgi:HEAT repeat protein